MFSRHVLFSGFMLSALSVFGQLNESFDEPEFENYAQWSGMTTEFQVNSDNHLQLNATLAGQSFVVAGFPAESLDDKEWRLWIKQGFSGSDNNQSRYYLTTNGNALAYSGTTASAGVQGYFLRFGEGGSSDAVRLFRDDGAGNSTLVLSGVEAAIASSFEINLKITRNQTGLWSLYADYGGGEFFQLQGTATDATYDTGTGVGIICNYTASNIANFRFDNLYFGPIITDNQPPQALSAIALSSNTVEVTFSEAIDLATGGNPLSYFLQGQGVPESVVPNGSAVILEFAQAFQENEQQTLNVSEVQDLVGNVMSPVSLNFMWFVPAVAQFRQVVFNEIFDDPTPVVGLPDAEYVEIYNPSEEPFDLEGWVLVNSTTPKTLSSYVLAPGEHLVLCNSTSTEFFDGLPVMGISGFVALVNGNDSLTLLSPQGEIIDYVAFKGEWHEEEFSDGGYSLEAINPELLCQSSSNWRTSTAEPGGTPGQVNSVYSLTVDSSGPVPVSVNAIDLFEIELWFSEAILDWDEVETAYLEVGPTIILTEKSGENKLRIVFTEPLDYGTSYTIFVSAVYDCAGNSTANASLDFSIGFPVVAGDVIINEIMAAPSSNTGSLNAEYVELYNRTDKLLDLTGIKLKTGTPIQGIQIAPFGFLVLTRVADVALFTDNIPVIGLNSFPQLTNAGMLLELRDSNDELLDSVEYSDKWYVTSGTSAGGYSLELINPDAPCSDASNWRASANPSGGTPGFENSIFDNSPDLTGPALLYVLAQSPTQFVVVFNKSIDPGNGPGISALIWEPGNSGMTVSAIEVSSLVHDPTFGNRLNVQLSSDLIAGKKYLLRLSDVPNCEGFLANVEVEIARAEQAQIGDVVVNEILSNPRGDGKDFVEIFNRSLKNVTLEGWALASEANGTIDNIRKFTDEPVLFLSGSYLAISNDIVNIKNEYPNAFAKRLWLTPSMPAYNNESGIVVLLDFLEQEMDKVVYDESMHFALLDNLDGVSLERIDPGRPSQDNTNWLSSAQAVGFATPGYENSQFAPGGKPSAEFYANPEIFSPDNDGFQDVVTFLFDMSSPGFAGSITIYDAEGRVIRKLVKNELLAISGSYSWDGVDEKGQKAAMGVYLAVLEYFNPEGQRGISKAVCVVGHKLN